MASIAYDLIYLSESLESLKNYLFSDEIFWNFPTRPPPGEPTYPALTLGGILFAKKRIEARELTTSQEAEYSRAAARLEQLRHRWLTAWEKKAAVEFNARLNQWRNFIEDYRQNPSGNADRYRYEVRFRVMLQLLGEGNPYLTEEQLQLLGSLDAVLSVRLHPAPFIWDGVYQKSFPDAQFPYLYCELNKQDEQLC